MQNRRRKRTILAVVEGVTGDRVKAFKQSEVRKIKVAEGKRRAETALDEVLARQAPRPRNTAHDDDDDDDDDNDDNQPFQHPINNDGSDDEQDRARRAMDVNTVQSLMAGKEGLEISNGGGEWEDLWNSVKGVKR